MKRYIDLVLYPSPTLFKQSTKVINCDDIIRQKLKNMMTGTKYFNGAGLAGVQIGYDQHLIYIDYPSIAKREIPQQKQDPYYLTHPLYIVNPVIKEMSDEIFDSNEGCLSLPGSYFNVERRKTILISYQDEYGNEKELFADTPYLAACIQHEIDHVNGITLLEHISPKRKPYHILKITEHIKKYQNFREMFSFDPSKHFCDTQCNH